MKNLNLTLIILFVFYFISSCMGLQKPKESHEKIADRITVKTANELEKNQGLILAGIGGQMMNDIQVMMIGLNCYKEVDIKEARDLLIYSSELYLFNINKNEKIIPHLHNYPFTEKNIEIVIYFRKPDGHKVSEGKINISSLNTGVLNYYINTQENQKLKVFHKETYEEAKKLVQNSNILKDAN